MIDTLALTLNQKMFTITDHDRFEPSTKGLYDGSYGLGGRGYITCKQNVTKTELISGIYKPNLTVTKRVYEGAYQIMMKVQLSAPKLIYKNNFEELEESDFELVVSTLRQKLKEMEVFVFSQLLAHAPLSAIHYSKNIPLTDGSSPYMYLKEVQKANINLRLDFNQTDFRNEGHSLKFRTNSFEVAFYDKLKDLQMAKISEKRTEEKDNAIQLNLFEKVSTQKPFELLRMEVRLNQRQKISQILRFIGKDFEPTFVNIFNQDTAKKVLLHYISEIEEAYPPLLTYQYDSPKKFFERLLVANPKIKLTPALKMLGLRVLLEEIGIREFREMTKRYSSSAWYSLNREMKELGELLKTSMKKNEKSLE